MARSFPQDPQDPTDTTAPQPGGSSQQHAQNHQDQLQLWTDAQTDLDSRGAVTDYNQRALSGSFGDNFEIGPATAQHPHGELRPKNDHPTLRGLAIFAAMVGAGAGASGLAALASGAGAGAGTGAATGVGATTEATIPTTFGIDAATVAALPGASAGPGAALAGLAGAGTGAATTGAATTPFEAGLGASELGGGAEATTTALPSTTIGTGAMPAISGTTGATTPLGVPAAASTGSRLADLYNVGKGLSSYAQTSANNRAAEAEIGQGGPAADAAAMKNLLHLNYLAGGGAPRFTGQNTPSGHIVPIGYQNPAVTGQQQSDAAMMRDTLIKKLQSGQAPTFSGVQPAGTGEKLAGTGALIASVAPSILHYFGF